MARRGIFQGLRRRGAVLCAVFAYALLLNALLAAVFNVQAVAAALDPLSGATNCVGTSSDPGDHDREHQPDCTLCGLACPMTGLVQGLGDARTVAVSAPASFGLDADGHPDLGIRVLSVYRSDTGSQAPPSIG
jgi:hypothetical protein